MFEINFIKFLNMSFPTIPTYSLVCPVDAPNPSFIFENAGQGVSQQYHNGKEIIARTVKLTVSSTDIKDIYQDQVLNKYIRNASKIGDLEILNAKILNFADSLNQETKIYERTYSIQIKYKQ